MDTEGTKEPTTCCRTPKWTSDPFEKHNTVSSKEDGTNLPWIQSCSTQIRAKWECGRRGEDQSL